MFITFHHISSHFITFINFSLNIYSQFRNPSSTITQLNATLPLLFYKNVYILTYSLFHKHLHSALGIHHQFITFYHFLSLFNMVLRFLNIVYLYIVFHNIYQRGCRFYWTFSKIHRISSLFITFHTLFTYFL